MDTSLIIIILAQFFGIIAWLLLMYSYTKEDIKELLFIQILVSAFDIASYLLLGASAGLLISVVELIKTILYFKTDKDRIIFYASLIAYTLIAIITINTWYALLPVIGTMIESYGTSKDTKIANICSIVTNILWTIYDLLILSYIGAINDITVVLCNISILLLGYSRLMHISKFRILKYNYLTKKTVEKIYKLDLKNLGEDNTWDKDYQMEVYKRNPDSFFAIKYNHDFIGYINYLNVPEEEYERLKRARKMPEKIDLDKIIKFKANKKSYIIIETINARKEYEKDETIELITKKISSFIKIKHNQRIYIHGILGYAINEFESKIYESLGFTKIKELEDNISLYELDENNINKRH